jgi:hypothetical protein
MARSNLTFHATGAARYAVYDCGERIGVVRYDRARGWWWAIAPVSDHPPLHTRRYGPYESRGVAGLWLLREKGMRAQASNKAA